jgi:protein TonB
VAVTASLASSTPATAPAVNEVSAADFKRTRFVAPTYPPQALSRGLEGEVRVRITIDTAGRVADAQVISGTPAGVFDQAAVNAVRKWRFEPVVKDGRPIEASVATTIRFQPDDARR